jgi:phage-related protein
METFKVLPAVFYRTPAGEEPVRTWLRALDKEDRTLVGEAIKVVEFGWPIGMPVCRSLTGVRDVWEVRCSLTHNRIARVLFYVKAGHMVLLHGFVKKTQKTPQRDLDLAVQRKKEHERYG